MAVGDPCKDLGYGEKWLLYGFLDSRHLEEQAAKLASGDDPNTEHYRSGLITLDEALKRATNPDEFRLKIQGVQFTSDISRDQMDESIQMPGESDFMAGGNLSFEIDQN